MGNSSTKILTYEEAIKRFSQIDIDRIEATFRDYTKGTNELDYTTFRRDVFANFLPEKLSQRLYQICINPSRSGMSYKELISCLAIIYYGSERERMLLLYAIITQTGTLSWYDCETFIRQCGDEYSDNYRRDEIVSQEQFFEWLDKQQRPQIKLIDWLLDEQRLREIQQFFIEKIFDKHSILAGVTHLSEKEIKDLEQTYQRFYFNRQQQQQIDLPMFTKILSPVLPSLLIPGIFEAFDENRDESIDFKEFVCGISAACRGPQFERYKFLFRVFDRDHDGILNQSDILYMSSCLIEIAQYLYVENIHINTSPEIYAETIVSKKDSILKLEDFLIWCQNDRLTIELIELIYQISHIVLGLRPSSPRDEILIVKNFLRREKCPFMDVGAISSRSTSKSGAIWYLISMNWWSKWESISTQTSPKTVANKTELGNMDNSSLIEKIVSNDCVQLKPNLRSGIHFEILPELLWIFLSKYYLWTGPSISRKVIYKKNSSKPELDLYPLIIKIYRNQNLSPQQMQALATNNNSNNNSPAMNFATPLMNYISVFGNNNTSNTPRHYFAFHYSVSQYQTIRSLADEFSIRFNKTLEEIRLWIRYNENELRQIDFESMDELTCQDIGLTSTSDLLLEIRNSDLTWPEELYTLAIRSKSLSLSSTSSSINVEDESRGLIGLSNLGNTCFLNAAVQSLSHTFALTFYFLHKYHLYEINKENPIGMQGNIALSYGHLISKLWGNVRGPLAPFDLRGLVAKFGSSCFNDFQQHDSQEFLAFLLDGLHEDLNRVHKKPYVELKDSDDRPDEDVASEHWSNHLARNTSIIVDLFHGLLRSQVKCRICEFKSVRFDPFNILSLPLPIDSSIYIEVKLIRLDGSKPVRYGMKLNGEQTVDQIKTNLTNYSSLTPEQIGFFDVTIPSTPRRYALMDSNQTKIKQLNIRDFVAYELPLGPYVIAIHRRLERQDRYLSPLTRYRTVFFGQPILISYDKYENKQIQNKTIYENIFQQLKRLLRKHSDLTSRSNHALDCDDSLGQKYPFLLKYVNENGTNCSVCPWNRCCFGCTIESNENEFVYNNGHIAIEWEASAYFLQYLPSREQDVEIHSSVISIRQSNLDDTSSMITLEDCLQSFISWENLDNKEMFQCKRCKQLQPADKKLDLWKLPPCLIFHIKRFQLSNNRWIKSSLPVRFPIESFQPSKYLAKRSSSIPSLLPSPTDDNLSISSSLSSLTTTDMISSSSNENNLILSPSRLVNGTNSTIKIGLPPPESSDDLFNTKKKRLVRRKAKRENLSNPSPPKFIQTNERISSCGDNSFDVDNASYDLYAFICHYGGIGGGHYVAFVKNHINQQWYCFNDSSCKPISDDLLNRYCSSAYLLFYQRQSLDHCSYMPNVEEKTPVADEYQSTNDDRWCSLM